MLCIFIFNLREIQETGDCQEMLSCSLRSMEKSALSGEFRGAQFIWKTWMHPRQPQGTRPVTNTLWLSPFRGEKTEAHKFKKLTQGPVAGQEGSWDWN